MRKAAYILAVGSELLSTDRLDTNSLFLTEHLEGLGLPVEAKSCVGDTLELLVEALRWALERFSLVITTGGLGPTEDDLTRQAVAQALGRPLERQEKIVEELKARFASFGRVMTSNNERQAMIVQGAEVLPNPRGTAPGMSISLSPEQTLVVLPGPPKELQPMFLNHVKPGLPGGEKVVLRSQMRVAGLGESAMDEKIAHLYKDLLNPTVTTLFTPEWLEVHVIAHGPTESECQALLDDLSHRLAEALGDDVFTRQAETLAEAVGRLLRERGQTLACAESLTGGHLGHLLTQPAGSSDYFLGSFVTYATRLKGSVLGVPEELLDNPVQAAVAEAMAAGARERSGADYALGLTGWAGPSRPEGHPDPVGTVYLGLADAEGVSSRRVILPGDRELVRQRACSAALDWLRRRMGR